MATLIIPTPLRKFTNGNAVFEASATSVNELLLALSSANAGIKKHLFDDAGELRR